MQTEIIHIEVVETSWSLSIVNFMALASASETLQAF